MRRTRYTTNGSALKQPNKQEATNTSGNVPSDLAKAIPDEVSSLEHPRTEKRARKILPRRIYGLAVVERVNVLPGIPQIVRPLSGCALLLFVWQQNDYPHGTGRETFGYLRPQLTFCIDLAIKFDHFHSCLAKYIYALE